MRCCRMLGFVIAVFLLATPGWTQTTTGAIHGVVTDDSGGVLPGVTVMLKGPATAGTPTTTTNEAGVYRLPHLTPRADQITGGLTRLKPSPQTRIPGALGGNTPGGGHPK